MAVGRISGPLLKSNLVRNGIDLAFETDLLYLDVNNQKIGIKTSSPQHELDVSGTTRTNNLTVITQADLADVTVQGSTISTDNNYLNLGTLDNVVYQNKLRIDSIDIEGNTISTNDSNANIEFNPNGTGSVEILADMNVTGNIHATGNITADGDIVLGDQDTDSIVFNAEIASDIVPDVANTYQLGTDPTTGGKQWKDIWVENFFASSITTDALTVNGIDLISKQGNIIYVAENGDDGNDGDHPQAPYATIQKAISVATDGDTIHIYPGNYTEVFPITVPVGVTVKGHSIRSVNISPTTETRYNDAFIVNGESTVEDLTVKDFYSGGNYFTITEIVDADTFKVNVGTAPFAHTYVSGGTVDFSDSTAPVSVTNAVYNHTTGELTLDLGAPHDSYVGHSVFISNLTFSCNSDTRVFPDNGWGFRFATDFEVTTRSPYIRNITVITKGTTITADDPRGFLSGDAGKGAYVDGAYATAASREAAMLFHSVTFITPGVDGLVATNGARIEWLNCFTYFANRGLYAFDSNDGFAGDGKTRIRLSGLSGAAPAGGQTVTFTSTDASTVIGPVNIESVDGGDILVIDGKDTQLLDFDTTPQSITFSGGGSATTIENIDVRDFGAEVRMIGSANVYGNYGLYGDGEGVIVYAIGQNLAYIGNGKEVTNDPESVNQANEVVELNDAKIRYSSVDHKGDFRVGDLFHVDQENGTVDFAATSLNISLTEGATFTNGVDSTFISGERIDTGNIRLSGNTITTTAGDLILDSITDQINLQNNVTVNGNIDVTGDVSIGGNITLGDSGNDNLQIIAGITSDLRPNVTSTFSLGTSSKLWGNLFVDQMFIDDLEINTNYIRTTTSNADLELRANGTGSVVLPNNDLQIDNNLTVDGTSTLGDLNITGDVNLTGNVTQTGDLIVTGNISANENLTVGARAQFENVAIDDNFITTTESNSDLELRASGTGQVLIPNNDVQITNNLTVLGDFTLANATSSGLITATEFNTDDILIRENFITTTNSNSNLELRTSGTGSIVIDELSIQNNTITAVNDLEIQTNTVSINGTGSINIPSGSIAQRPTPTPGAFRFNSDENIFEGYDGSAWIKLDGLQDLDGDTRITAELTPGANDATIRFYVENQIVADINKNRFNSNRLTVDDIEIDGNVISSITTNTDINLTANGTGLVKLENIGFTDSTIRNTVSDAVTVFENTGNGYVKFDGTQGVVIPVGDNTTRPTGVQGMIRFNTADSRVELYDGTSWVSVAGASGGISFAQAEEIAIEKVLIFG
jgi:cytoskeletal protein CcmA (bactofilin family)